MFRDVLKWCTSLFCPSPMNHICICPKWARILLLQQTRGESTLRQKQILSLHHLGELISKASQLPPPVALQLDHKESRRCILYYLHVLLLFSLLPLEAGTFECACMSDCFGIIFSEILELVSVRVVFLERPHADTILNLYRATPPSPRADCSIFLRRRFDSPLLLQTCEI